MAIVSGSVVVTDPAAPPTRVIPPTSGAVFTSPGPGGPQGDDSTVPGPPNVLHIGTVTGGPNAVAEIVGESPSQTLNLVLPKGDKGDQGDPGEVSEAELTAAINAALDQVIDGSPGSLDTLNELAAALGDDPNFAATVTAQIAAKADKLRQIIAGVGLTGGGTLEADRTLAIDFGTGTNQAVRGDDSRLSNARTPTSHQHNATDINAGTLAVARLGDGTITAAKLVQAVQDILTKANNATPVWKGTQAAYNAITTKDANTVYVIAG